MLQTRLCQRLGIDFPIIAAPMGPDLSGPALVAAVSGAGGLGILQAQLCPPEVLRAQIRQIRAQTNRPFGVNFILRFPSEEGIAVCLEEGVRVLSLFWGDPSPYVEQAHAAGALIFHQVGTVAAAEQAVEAGVDVIVAQGFEAGGHGEGEVSTLALVPRVVDAVAPRPVVAAGGIADARGLVAVLALGAEAAALGTRFLATPEAHAHLYYKERLVAASEEDTRRTTLFDTEWPEAPHRVLRTPFVERWHGRKTPADVEAAPVVGTTEVAGRLMELRRFTGFPPNAAARGDVASMSMAAGQGVGLVEDVRPAAEIVRELADDARRIIERTLTPLAGAVPA